MRSASMEDFRPARVEVVDDPARRVPPPADVSRDTQVPAAAVPIQDHSGALAFPCHRPRRCHDPPLHTAFVQRSVVFGLTGRVLCVGTLHNFFSG